MTSARKARQLRRERIAASILTGLLASHTRGDHERIFAATYADDAVALADALIDALDRKKP